MIALSMLCLNTSEIKGRSFFTYQSTNNLIICRELLSRKTSFSSIRKIHTFQYNYTL